MKMFSLWFGTAAVSFLLVWLIERWDMSVRRRRVNEFKAMYFNEANVATHTVKADQVKREVPDERQGA